MKIVILLGPPGCGKGTQAELLEREKGLTKLSTGDMLRDMAKEESPVAYKLRDIMESGQLVPDEFIIKALEEKLANENNSNGFILDGFPRTVVQAEHLEHMFNNNLKLREADIRAVSISAGDDEIVKRISGRFSCSKCNAGYHDLFKPTLKEGVCDHCGGVDFTRRKDDNAETVKNRLDAYNADTAPIIDFYSTKSILSEIDGEQDMKQVYSEVIKSIS